MTHILIHFYKEIHLDFSNLVRKKYFFCMDRDTCHIELYLGWSIDCSLNNYSLIVTYSLK